MITLTMYDKYGNLRQGGSNGGMVGPHPQLGQQVDVVLRLRDLLPDCLAFNYDKDFNDDCSRIRLIVCQKQF